MARGRWRADGLNTKTTVRKWQESKFQENVKQAQPEPSNWGNLPESFISHPLGKGVLCNRLSLPRRNSLTLVGLLLLVLCLQGREQTSAPRMLRVAQRWVWLGTQLHPTRCKSAGRPQSTAQYQLHRLTWLRALGVSRTRSEVSHCTCGVWPHCLLGMACPWVALPADCPCDTLLIWPHPCPAFWEGRPPLSLIFAAAWALLQRRREKYRQILRVRLLKHYDIWINTPFKVRLA